MNQTLTVILLAAAALAPKAPAQGPSRRASVDSAGIPANDGSWHARITPDASCVAFVSRASNLVPNDTNGVDDVFVRDYTAGTTTRVSVRSDGAQANGSSSEMAITPDGRYVAFTSAASNLVPFDTNGRVDVFRHDRVTGATVLVSCSLLGIQGNDGSGNPTISDDGRYVAFHSLAGNLVPGDGNGAADVFVKDLQTGVIVLASTAAPAQPGNFGSLEPKLSGDGRFLAFRSYATNLVPNDTNGVDDVFVRDLLMGTTSRANLGPNGLQANSGGYLDGITRDGSEVVYSSFATNLLPGNPQVSFEVYVSARDGSHTELISATSNGNGGNDGSLHAVITPDGRYVAFETRASDLLPGDLNHLEDTGVFDRVTRTMLRGSRSLGGGNPNGACPQPALSGDGRFVVFESTAPNLIFGKTGTVQDIVVIDLRPAVPATFTAYGQGCQGSRGVPQLDHDDATLPWLGTTLRFNGANALGSTLGVLALGWSQTNWNGMPLPLALGNLGMNGCTLFTSVDFTLTFVTMPNGLFQQDLAIPAAAGWLGTRINAQTWLLDPWANNALGATVSNAAAMRLGG